MSNKFFIVIPIYWVISLAFNIPSSLVVQAVIFAVFSMWIFFKIDRSNPKANFKMKLWVNLSLVSIIISLFLMN